MFPGWCLTPLRPAVKPMPSVGVDNYLGGCTATEHLLGLGHRHIAMLAGRFSFFVDMAIAANVHPGLTTARPPA
jgi:hypothetical protein